MALPHPTYRGNYANGLPRNESVAVWDRNGMRHVIPVPSEDSFRELFRAGGPDSTCPLETARGGVLLWGGIVYLEP